MDVLVDVKGRKWDVVVVRRIELGRRRRMNIDVWEAGQRGYIYLFSGTGTETLAGRYRIIGLI